MYSKIISNPNYLSGYRIEFHLKESFGDPYYIGLNEVEIFDHLGQNVLQNQYFDIQAFPPGVQIFHPMVNDQRIAENLSNGIKKSTGYENIWLAPLVQYRI